MPPRPGTPYLGSAKGGLLNGDSTSRVPLKGGPIQEVPYGWNHPGIPSTGSDTGVRIKVL